MLALEAAKKRAHHIVILDIDEQAGLNVCHEVKEVGTSCSFIKVDLASQSSIAQAVEKIYALVPSIDIVINNAGIVIGKLFQDHLDAEIERTISINLHAPMYLTHKLLPGMLNNHAGHIVNVASAAGMAAHPKLSVYAASKWGMIGWSESLRLELEQGNTGIKVTTVTPYYINTGMFKGVKSPIIPLLKPEVVAKKIIKAIEKNKIFSRMPGIVYAMPFFKGILPQRWFDAVVGKVFGVYGAMDFFEGREQLEQKNNDISQKTKTSI